MKIALIGEFSSLHKYLKDGLLEIGHEVTLVSSGDMWKKIGGEDIIIPTRDKGVRKYYDLYIAPLSIAQKIKNYDVVQFINPKVFSSVVGTVVFDIIKRNNGIISLAAAGDDYALIKSYLKGNFEYYAIDYDKDIINKYDKKTISGRMYSRLCDYYEENSDIIIPSLYEYTFEHLGNVSKVIPFPINVKNIQYRENIIRNGKVVFFHGLNRELSKGTPFIKEALARLKQKYPNDIEIIMDGRMPFEEYLRVISRANVVIDQCCCYGYGINACISMAEGKVVMAGARPETLGAFGLKSAPIVHTCPSVDFLFKQMENILANKHHLAEIGYQSRRYIEALHDHKKVARQYEDQWNVTRNKKCVPDLGEVKCNS